MSGRKYALSSTTSLFENQQGNGDHFEEKYRCTEHGRIQCVECLDHQTHFDMSGDPDVEGRKVDELDYTSVMKDLDRLVSLVTVAQKKLQHNKKEINEYYSTAMSEMKKLRKDVNDLIDKLERDLVSEISKFNDEDTTAVVIAAGNCDLLKLKTNTSLRALKESKRDGKNDHLYVALKTAQCSIPIMSKEVNSYLENDLVTRYRFDRSGVLSRCLTKSGVDLMVAKSASELKTKHVANIDIRTEDDNNDCLVSGMAVLPNNRVAVSDSGNKCLKLIDSVKNKVIAQIKLSSKPFDVTTFKDDRLAVSFSTVKRLAVFSVVHDMFTHPTYIELDRCLGIRQTGNRIIGVDQHPGAVKIYDMDGKTRQTFRTDTNGEAIFDMPRYLALSPDRCLIYLTDWKSHSVTCVTLDGEIVSEYRNDDLRRPYGVTVDETGSVYVSSMDGHAVHVLTPMCHIGRVLIGRDDGLSPCPGCIAYCRDSRKLFVSSRSKASELKNTVSVFQLE